MKQLDIDVSPPAFLWDPYLALTNVTFDLDPCDLLALSSNKMCIPIPNLVNLTQTVPKIWIIVQ